MGTHNICLYKEADKKYTGCNLKNKELLDCALIGVCVVIRSNTVAYFRNSSKKYVPRFLLSGFIEVSKTVLISLDQSNCTKLVKMEL